MPVITLDVVVSDLDETLLFFDRIEVHRSTTLSTGPFTEITNLDDPTPAVLDGAGVGPFNLDGLTLELYLDLASEAKAVIFEGTDPLSLQDVIDQINEVVEDLASEVPSDTNQLRLTSATTGTASAIVVIAGDAATVLGLSTTKVNGKERRPRIVEPTTFYRFYDKDGENEFWYKTRYSSSSGPLTSSFSIPRQGNVETVLPADQLIKATAYLANGVGEPVRGRRVIFTPTTNYAVPTSTYNIIPGFDARVEVLSDNAGFVEANLVKGVTYRVAFEGTSYMREFIAPTAGSSFDLLALIGTSPDPFDIVQTPPRPIKVTI